LRKNKFFFYSINNNKYPTKLAIKNNNKVINKLFLILLLSLYKYTRPSPALQIKPDIVAAKVNVLLIYNSLIITEDAQLGINPIIEESSGVKYTFAFKKLAMLSSPIK
jgi:hypothetical protein